MEEKFEKEIYQLSDYIFQLFKDSNAEVDDALYIMSAACDHVMRTLCKAIDEDPERMITIFCNALQGGLKKNRIYSTGSEESDEMMMKMVNEIKAGGNVEEIVDRYVNCETPELRQQVISGIRKIVGDDLLQNVQIGYK